MTIAKLVVTTEKQIKDTLAFQKWFMSNYNVAKIKPEERLDFIVAMGKLHYFEQHPYAEVDVKWVYTAIEHIKYIPGWVDACMVAAK